MHRASTHVEVCLQLISVLRYERSDRLTLSTLLQITEHPQNHIKFRASKLRQRSTKYAHSISDATEATSFYHSALHRSLLSEYMYNLRLYAEVWKQGVAQQFLEHRHKYWYRYCVSVHCHAPILW